MTRSLPCSWSRECLEHACALALGSAIDASSATAYGSALNSYLFFCRSHDFPIDPTPDTLSFYTIYMAHHIKPSSVDSYLSGICNELELFHPDVRKNCHHHLVTRTLWGCKKLRAIPTTHKCPLSRTELAKLHTQYMLSNSHNDLLFFVILLVGFHALMCLGELVWPDKKDLQDFRKVTTRDSVELLPKGFSFYLPGHKANRFFEGNKVIVQQTSSGNDLDEPFHKYLKSHDHLFPFHPQLWLQADGSVPTRGWFIHHLHQHFPADITGHSLHAGGATALAQAGIPPHIIQAIGRWASDTFQIYIRHHLVLLTTLLFSNRSSTHWLVCFYHTSSTTLFSLTNIFSTLTPPLVLYTPTPYSYYSPLWYTPQSKKLSSGLLLISGQCLEHLYLESPLNDWGGQLEFIGAEFLSESVMWKNSM